MLTPIYIALLQNALRALPNHELTVDLTQQPLPWPDDGLDMMMVGQPGGLFTARLLPHDQAVREREEFAATADVQVRGDNGEHLMIHEVEDDTDEHDQPGGLEGVIRTIRSLRKRS